MLGALVLVGCASGRVPLVGERAPRLRDMKAEEDYAQTLDRFSAHAQIYDGADTRAFLACTYQSDEFVTARVTREGQFRAEPGPVVAEHVAQAKQELAPFHEFFLAVHVNNPRYDDFDRRGSIWRVALVTPGGEAVPSELVRIGRSTLNLRALYPYFDDFWVAYRVRFPRLVGSSPLVPPEAAQATLKVASPLGRADLTVHLRP